MSRFLSKTCDNPHEEARRRREVRTGQDGPDSDSYRLQKLHIKQIKELTQYSLWPCTDG